LRANKVLCFLMFLILTIVANVYAQEASFYDPVYNWIIRCYKDTSNNLIIEVRNPDGSFAGNARINNGINPTTVAKNISSFSLAYNTTEHKAYILYPSGSAESPTLKTFDISSATIASGPNIVADPLSIDYGNINIGGNADRTITLRNTGTADGYIGYFNLSSGPFELIKEGTTCNSNQSLEPNRECNIVVRFAPTTNGQFNATLSVGSISISLYGNGVGGGQGGADVRIIRIDHNCWSNEEDIFTKVYLHNQGTSSASNFTVTVSIQRNNALYPDTPPRPEILLGTWNVDVINANETKILEKTVRFMGLPIHTEYLLIFKINLNDSDTSNNIATSRCYLGR